MRFEDLRCATVRRVVRGLEPEFRPNDVARHPALPAARRPAPEALDHSLRTTGRYRYRVSEEVCRRPLRDTIVSAVYTE